MSSLAVKEKKISELEAKVNELEQTLVYEKNRLRQAIGAWRRKVEGKGAKRKSLREGYNADTGMHYKVYVLQDIPEDLAIEFVLKVVKDSILPEVYPFTFRKIDYSNKYKGWILEVERPLNIDIRVQDEFLIKYYR
ncbi:hypothetical protein [Caldibacillus thermoamylovorans]|jgi:hypothetical protein|uniref:hypothetical protein n=1 Tax=Caldibacillus thermoamylovorans TaxID=35841 RepID=UPI0020424A69|nr:hypothetical protein [Caldibacillus thermoamylovorans]MCM3054326.1 hypothetical protein [Caldibacillus thermoamylovorans]